jgi:hypothetical protein
MDCNDIFIPCANFQFVSSISFWLLFLPLSALCSHQQDQESPSHVVLVRCVEDLEAQKDFALSPLARAERVVTALEVVEAQSLLREGTAMWRKMIDIGTMR